MSLLCLILAGGKSIRMGRDKALLYDSVNQLSQKLTLRGTRIIVACGSPNRANLFNSECWFDPADALSLADVLRAFVQEHDEEIQLFPCDMYNLDDEAIDAILAQLPGVPVDQDGREQFTLARIPKGCTFSTSSSLKGLFSDFERNQMDFLDRRLENFNFPTQIDDLNKSAQ